MQLKLTSDMTNHQVAEIFEFIAGVLQVQNSNPFRVRAYQNAADSLRHLPKPFQEYISEHYNLEELPGIGETIAEKLNELYKTGNIAAFQKYVAGIPEGMYALMPVHGIGPKFAYRLAMTFNLDSEQDAISKLMEHARNGEINGLEGFGEKREKEILEALERYNHRKQRVPYDSARKLADDVIGFVKTHCENITKIKALGSLRRQVSSIGDIDIGLVTSDFDCVKTSVKSMDHFGQMLVAGDQLISFTLTTKGTILEGQVSDIQVDIKRVPAEEWGSFIQHFTGSKEHNIKLREFALKQNKSLSEHGIKDTTTNKMKTFDTEKEFYRYLGLEWIPPEKRVGQDEIAKAQAK